jgi:hypothetical protein
LCYLKEDDDFFGDHESPPLLLLPQRFLLLDLRCYSGNYASGGDAQTNSFSLGYLFAEQINTAQFVFFIAEVLSRDYKGANSGRNSFLPFFNKGWALPPNV